MNEKIYKALINVYTKEHSNVIFEVKKGKKSIESFKKEAFIQARDIFPAASDEVIESTIKEFIDNIFGYSVLTELIQDKSITDIKVHDWNKIVIKKKGRKMKSDVTFASPEHYKRFIENVITRNEINASNVNAIRRFTDDDSDENFILRFTLVTPYLTTNKNYELIIRKVLKNFYSMDDLVKEEMLTDNIKEYLINSWHKGSILICGANSSGKTTMLNALKEEIPHDRSVLVIQQAEELTTKNHPDMIFLHSVEGNGESDTHYDLKELSIAGLTMDIDYFIIGEVKGAEANYLLNASYTGHICGATIHAYDSKSALDKLVDYALYTGSYTKPELMNMLSNFKTVVFMKNFKVEEISEVHGYKDGKMIYDEVFSRNKGINYIEYPESRPNEIYKKSNADVSPHISDISDNTPYVPTSKPENNTGNDNKSEHDNMISEILHEIYQLFKDALCTTNKIPGESVTLASTDTITDSKEPEDELKDIENHHNKSDYKKSQAVNDDYSNFF